MGLKNSLNIVQKQRLHLTIQQGLKILGLNQLELRAKIDSAIAENPFLEETKPAKEKLSEELKSKIREYNKNIHADGQKAEFLDSLVLSNSSLQELLNNQLLEMNIPKELTGIIRLIISSIDKRGFVSIPHAELANSIGVSPLKLKKAIKFLMQLEPSGVCAENVWQSLEWQSIIKYPEETILHDILRLLRLLDKSSISLTDEVRKNLADILHISPNTVDQALEKIRTLDPFPARDFQNEEETFIYPEIFYIEKNNKIEIKVKQNLLPELSLNETLIEQFRKNKKKEEWEEKYQDAQNLLKSIAYRNNSLEKVAQAIAFKQPDFFQEGPSKVFPMNLSDIADIVNLHISTVSRIVMNKYCECKWGIFPLKFFFPYKLKSTDGSIKSSVELKEAILNKIQTESAGNPFSDHEIAELLKEDGFDIQRRTVAKYRKIIKIPSSRSRKKEKNAKF